MALRHRNVQGTALVRHPRSSWYTPVPNATALQRPAVTPTAVVPQAPVPNPLTPVPQTMEPGSLNGPGDPADAQAPLHTGVMNPEDMSLLGKTTGLGALKGVGLAGLAALAAGNPVTAPMLGIAALTGAIRGATIGFATKKIGGEVVDAIRSYSTEDDSLAKSTEPLGRGTVSVTSTGAKVDRAIDAVDAAVDWGGYGVNYGTPYGISAPSGTGPSSGGYGLADAEAQDAVADQKSKVGGYDSGWGGDTGDGFSSASDSPGVDGSGMSTGASGNNGGETGGESTGGSSGGVSDGYGGGDIY